MLKSRGKLLAKTWIEIYAIYDDAIGNCDKVWGVKELLYYGNDTNTMHWHIRAPNVGLVNHV